MIYDIEMITINDTPIRPQDGYVLRTSSRITYWMGNTPTEDELKPKQHLYIKWNRVIIPLDTDLITEPFNFNILTTEGDTFSGKAFFVEPLQTIGKYQTTEAHPLVITFEEDIVTRSPEEKKQQLKKSFQKVKPEKPLSFSEITKQKFESEYLGELYKPTEEEQNALNAAEEWLRVPYMFISARQMKFIADKHNTTIKEMRRVLNERW